MNYSRKLKLHLSKKTNRQNRSKKRFSLGGSGMKKNKLSKKNYKMIGGYNVDWNLVYNDLQQMVHMSKKKEKLKTIRKSLQNNSCYHHH